MGGEEDTGRYIGVVPEISRFLGIVIATYFRDHAAPHSHALYGEFAVTVEIATGAVDGEFPRRALSHVPPPAIERVAFNGDIYGLRVLASSMPTKTMLTDLHFRWWSDECSHIRSWHFVGAS